MGVFPTVLVVPQARTLWSLEQSYTHYTTEFVYSDRILSLIFLVSYLFYSASALEYVFLRRGHSLISYTVIADGGQDFRILLMTSNVMPNAFIFDWPLTATIESQTEWQVRRTLSLNFQCTMTMGSRYNDGSVNEDKAGFGVYGNKVWTLSDSLEILCIAFEF